MSVMFPLYFGIPQQVVRSGLWARMKPGECRLYVYLLHESERRSTREFSVRDLDVAQSSGVKPRTICNARKKLAEYQLIRYVARCGNIYVYTVCNPETGLPYPGDPKVQARYAPKRENADGSNNVHPPLVAPVLRERDGASLAAPSASAFKQPGQPEIPLSSYGFPGVFDDLRSASFAEPRR